MKFLMRSVVLVLGLATMTCAFARSDVKDGNAIIKPISGEKFSIDGSIMGKAELYGYIGDLREREHLTGLALKRGGDDAQRQVIGSIARALGLKAFEQDGGDLKPIDLPAAAPTPPAPPIESQQPAGEQPVAPAAPVADPIQH